MRMLLVDGKVDTSATAFFDRDASAIARIAAAPDPRNDRSRQMIDPSGIDALVFDVGGVFLVPDPEPIGALMNAGGVEIDTSVEAFTRAHYHGAHAMARLLEAQDEVVEMAKDSWLAYDCAFFLQLGVAEAELERAHEVRHAQRGTPVGHVWSLRLTENIEAFHRLADTELPLAVVSNNDGSAAEQLVDAGVCQVGDGPLPRVEVIVDSALVGVAKPDPAIFDPAVEALAPTPRERILYVGDTYHADVLGAQRAGLQVVQLDPFDLHADHGHPTAPDLGTIVELFVD